MEANEQKPHALIVGDQGFLENEELKPLLSGFEVFHKPYDFDQLIEAGEESPLFVLCTEPPQDISVQEVAQTLDMTYQDARVFIILSSESGFRKKDLVKNGFDEAFYEPFDMGLLKSNIEKIHAAFVNRGRYFRPVKIVDFEPGTQVDFDTYLYMPANKKFVCFTRSGETLSEEKKRRLDQHKVSSLHIDEKDTDKFYNYTANRLREIRGDSAISETERRDKLSAAVRDLFSGLFESSSTSVGEGRSILENCQQIVKSYVLSTPANQWLDRVNQMVAEQSDIYSHAMNVSTFGALFSIALDIGKPEEIALAGLLHDIGLAKIPAEIQKTPEHLRTQEQHDAYKKHPEFSIEMIQNRKIPISDKIQTMILQHHEAYNGSGFPKGLVGTRISEEAQLLSLANYLENLTSLKEGSARLGAHEAVEYLNAMVTNDPSKIIFDPKLLKRVLSLFQEPEQEKVAA
jgi:HD-GYP domain-containing protein (c-di-GMP phosphodiesterase class II)